MLSFALVALLIANMAASTSVKDAFIDNGVVPDVIDAVPKQLLSVTYNDGLVVQPGIELTPTQVQKQPSVEWTPAKSDAYYTLIFSDPDAPSRANPKFREFKHWVVINIPGNDLSQGEVLAAYIGSGPPKDTGLHRYVFLLYLQPNGKLNADKETRVSNRSRNGRPNFSAARFAEKYDLGSPIASNFYQAQYDDYVPILHKQLSEN